MKRNLLILTAAFVAAGSLSAAPKDDVLNAVKKLADASSYSWSSSTTNLAGGGGGRGGRGGGPLSGSASKDGFAFVTATGGQGNTEVALKGDKVAIKTPDGGAWQTVQEALDGGARGAGRYRTLKAPATEAKDLAEKAKDLKAAGDAISGDLGADAVGPLLAFGGRGGGGGNPPPAPANAKGSVKFWIKEGTLAKYEYNVQGTMDFGGNTVDINRTTTIEIKDVGTAKVNVPEDAKKKLQ
jgi:hypothetical protein